MAIPVKTSKDTRNIATVSASGNQFVGKTIAECFEKAGKNGVVAIEEGKGTETTIEMVEGMQIDRGYLSSYFCTNPDKSVSKCLSRRFSSLTKKSLQSKTCCRLSNQLLHRDGSCSLSPKTLKRRPLDSRH